MNPIEFTMGEFAQDIFTGEIVRILQHGSWWTKIQDSDGRVFELNSWQNPRYRKVTNLQLSLF